MYQKKLLPRTWHKPTFIFSQAIALQNSELNLNENEIKPKFMFEDRKKHKNLVIEMNSEIRKRLVDRKLKIGWHVTVVTI